MPEMGGVRVLHKLVNWLIPLHSCVYEFTKIHDAMLPVVLFDLYNVQFVDKI